MIILNFILNFILYSGLCLQMSQNLIITSKAA